ncbi:tRNA preQ1(34) S-adenosylmethionine ribosyltransferase-isomerase QueA [Candidatus Uhrbacteria bacterium RIFOXYB12_FULL_58_10]|uniref:S-adenosylmethionine:tRNA ribosyltransferase-isomerase n=1 Tax=Candidatus Uhrbacteria bacterium RIFOXYB2_FULL_57_15 TaxID=1802422 RepID=A0A1F7W8D6_9BACT|nr:MAG: tRNA preQ1(34) S-adenosylmethionine ribosyltransferase-isomerase QueA [Candidatus Uhrbacteria bacterium RIFOXYB12_FULL_58_10]OGL98896.1 MAG: tRNA preQ1(34) S-adenosylmethionine ribosyltransferase-isomerase QueA [Candidatus Uhrbacteria bacterium RIFOXYB2_FULL_57_15]OGM00067.1 MAG: tRNA preQ1(34) S-adenosylmethionine ribosyltransferase-isomerase QueA [Candidatus Uhrbacteria bacterium RIFOXYC12_FULL_57_11]
MGTSIDLFSYHLPSEQIAQEPARPRDHSRLLLLGRATGKVEHRRFFDIEDELCAGDVLVMNDTKVFRARLSGECKLKNGESKIAEVFLLRGDGKEWSALLRPGRKAKIGDAFDLGGLVATVVGKHEDGTATLAFEVGIDEVLAFSDVHGRIPVPPYVDHVPEKLEDYQTVYAKETGSVAAPTAGFHFTPELIASLKEKGVQFEFVTLHVGIGTFRPVKVATLEEHEMHREFVLINAGTASRINAAKREGRRVIAVGTTTVRSLEGSGVPETGFVGDVNLFITPGFDFRIIDGLITNFHLPKSTLLVLVSAFAGRERVLAAYGEAVRLGYRFFSFGDAMFIR